MDTDSNLANTPAGTLNIRDLQPEDIEDLVQLSLLTWAPVFRSFKDIFGVKLFGRLYPLGVECQRDVVEGFFKSEAATTLVADVDGVVAGFSVFTVNVEAKSGEIELLAVHPRFHNQGIGTVLNEVALEQIQTAGATLAIVRTGGDKSHAAARRSYEKAGFTAMPCVNYFKKLG
jgi:ribosomal protein S18 acetylase RimI-like enzyme